MSATQPGFARIWAWRDEMGDVYTAEWAPEGDTHVPVEAKEYTLSEVSEPTEPGGFNGDIFYGDPVKTTMGTHRWENGQWVRLPSEMESVLSLLADARVKLADAEAAQALAALRAERDAALRLRDEAIEKYAAGADKRLADQERATDLRARLAAAEGRVAALRAERDEWKRLAVVGELTARNLAIVQAERDDALARLAAAEGRMAALTEAATNLMEAFPDPCRHDHHGYCQEHFLEAECSVLALKNVIATVTPPADTGRAENERPDH